MEGVKTCRRRFTARLLEHSKAHQIRESGKYDGDNGRTLLFERLRFDNAIEPISKCDVDDHYSHVKIENKDVEQNLLLFRRQFKTSVALKC